MKTNLIILLFTCTSCATIVSQHTYKVSVKAHENSTVKVTDRNGQTVTVDTSPFKVKLRSNDGAFRRNNYQFEFVRNDTILETRTLKCRLDFWVFGNIFLGTIPLLIDGLNGSMYKLDTKTIK